MPRLKENQVPKYGRHRQSGKARVVLNGRHYLLGPHGSKASRQEYDRLVAQWIARGRRGQDDTGGGLTVVTFINHPACQAVDVAERRADRCRRRCGQR